MKKVLLLLLVCINLPIYTANNLQNNDTLLPLSSNSARQNGTLLPLNPNKNTSLMPHELQYACDYLLKNHNEKLQPYYEKTVKFIINGIIDSRNLTISGKTDIDRIKKFLTTPNNIPNNIPYNIPWITTLNNSKNVLSKEQNEKLNEIINDAINEIEKIK